MMMKKMVFFLILVLVVAGVTQAATEAQKRAAIDQGLAYLATQQAADGHFEYGDLSYDNAASGAALLAFLEEGHTPWSGTLYSGVVTNGLNYVLGQATRYAIGVEPTGNPDTNGNGYGLKFYPGGNNSRDTYDTGLVLAAVGKAAALNPGAVVGVGSEAGRTYAQVVQDTVDYLAYGQADPGNTARGGWRYYADYGQSDNSTAQWPVVGLLYAGAVPGVTVPAFVAPELRIWTNWIQNADGGSDYDTGHGWGSNVSRTGGWLMEAAFAGTDASLTPADINAALAYINGQWQTTANSTWNGNFNHPYAMWAAYKGLELTIGLDATTGITNLHAFTPDAVQPDPTVIRDSVHNITIDWNDQWTWWQDYCESLVDRQLAGGNWPGYGYWYGVLEAAWDINILNATQVPFIPAPAAVVLGMLGLSAAGWRLRRRGEL